MSSTPNDSKAGNKRKGSCALLEDIPPKKRDKRPESVFKLKLCTVCNGNYTNERSHKALCTRLTVSCSYPSLQLGGPVETIVLHRRDGLFHCVRCEKSFKKDQNMKSHARECDEISPSPDGPPASAAKSGPSSSAGPSSSVVADSVGSSVVRSSNSVEAPLLSEPLVKAVETHMPMIDNTSSLELTLHDAGPAVRSSSHNIESIGPCAQETRRSVGDIGRRVKETSELSCPNEHESLIRPDDHSIVDDPFLLRTPYIVNTKYMVLICTQCKHSVTPDNASTHAHRRHRSCKVPESFVVELNKAYPALKAEKIHPGSVVEPIFGLAVPIQQFVICARCLRGYSTQSSWRSHDCDDPLKDLNGGPPHFPSFVQTFFRGPKLCYLPIETPGTDKGGTDIDDFARFQSQSSQLDTVEDEIVEPADYRELDQFLFKEGWISHVAGNSRSELSTLTRLPQQDESLAPIRREVFVLMSRIQLVIGAAGFYVRRLLGRRPSDNHDSIRTVHHRDIREDSMKGYSVVITSLVCFVMRCHQGWNCSYTMGLTDAQRRACVTLQDALQHSRSGTRVNAEPNDLGHEQDWYGYVEVPGDEEDCEVEDGHGEDGEDDEDDEDGEGSPTDEAAQRQITENTLQACILDLLISLYTQLPTGNDDKFFSPIIRFAVLASLQSSGAWLPPRRITHLLAILLFCGREVMMALMHQRLIEDPKIRYSKAFDAISSFFDDDREGPIPSIYLLMRPLNRFASAEEGALRFTALDFGGDNIIVDGQVLYLRDIRRFVDAMIAEIKERIQTKLFFGLDVVDIHWSPGIVHEEPRNLTVGYSCFRDARNDSTKHQKDLLKLVLTHPRIRGHFHYVDQQGCIVWKAAPCFAYMQSCHEVEMLLFCGTQTSVGEPARGTEISSNLLENVSGGTLRNVLVMFQYFCMMGTFNKTSHLTERDVNMMRVPHPEIGRLWMLYLTFVRPLVVVWQKSFGDRKAAARAKTHLFFGPHRPVTPSELSQSLAKHTHRLLNVKISIRLWRHIATWFLNQNSTSFCDHLALSNRSALALQMGHSDATHSLYAADTRLPAKIDFHIFFQTMRTSGLWHRLLNFKSTLLRDMDRRNTGDANANQQAERSVRTSGRSLDVMPSLPANSISSIAEAVKKTLMPEIVRATIQTRANDLASLLDAVGLNVQTPVSRPVQGVAPLTHIMHPSRLRDLRAFLGDNNAAFKHTQQALATELIASKNPSILLVGPTGSGKTLPLFLSIVLYDGGISTILILPLLAMHDEYRIRATTHGLSCETWTVGNSQTISAQLILVAVENCAWDELKIQVETLIRLGRLARIVVDEAHLLLKHSSFRPCVDMLEYFGRMPTSILLMTATCPHGLEQKLFAKLGRTVYQVLRRSIERPEIAQKMVAVASNDMEETVAANIVSITKHFRGHDRALLFCWSHAECDSMAKALGWRPYHASIPLEERTKFMKMWKNGDIQGLACTSMLNCCLDYPAVRYVFHLGQPRDAIDYYQAIGRAVRNGEPGQSVVYFDPHRLKKATGDDPYGVGVIYDMLRDNSLCRRLRPAMFFDGSAVPCAMLPNAQLCDICEAEATRVPPSGPLRFPAHLLPAFDHDAHSATILVPTSHVAQSTTNHPAQPVRPATVNVARKQAPSTTAAPTALKQVPLHYSHERGLQIHRACQALTKSCVHCWAHGTEYHSHCLANCLLNKANEVHPEWKTWSKSLRLPAGCCFFCGCPSQVTYKLGDSHLPVHDHPADQSCHWVSIFKPLSFIVFRDAQLAQHIFHGVSHRPPIRFGAGDFRAYAKWLGESGENGMLNLIHVFLLVCELQGSPQ